MAKNNKQKPKFTVKIHDFKNIPVDAFRIFKNGRNNDEEEENTYVNN